MTSLHIDEEDLMTAPTINLAVFDTATVEDMNIISNFAQGASTDAYMAERIIRPWLDADTRAARRRGHA